MSFLRDPTRSAGLRRSGRAMANRKMFELHRRLRVALQEHDLVGLRQRDVVPEDFLTYVEGDDGRLERSEFLLRRIVEETLLRPPDWLRALIARSVWKGVQQVGQELKTAIEDLDPSELVNFHAAAARIETEGIADETGRRTLRSVANALEARQTPELLMREVREALQHVTKRRLILLVNTAVVRGVNAGKLFGYRAQGIKRVGIQAEWKPGSRFRDHTHDAAAVALAMLKSAARKRKRKGARREARSPRTQQRREAAERRLAAALEHTGVEVLTAGDDKVCENCQAIANGGPYSLDRARGLIPAHPNCRCAFVPFGDARFSSIVSEEV